MNRALLTFFALLIPISAQAQKGDIHACTDVVDGTMRATDDPAQCARGEESLSWNLSGPQGPAGPQGPRGLVGPVGPMGPSGTGVLVKTAVYTVIEENPDAGGFREAYCESPDDILLNCSCRPPVGDYTIWAPIAMNHTVSDTPDFCRCVANGAAGPGGTLGHGRGQVLEVHATCVSAAGPVCGGNPPQGYGETCDGVCQDGRILCDGTCDAPPAPDDQGDACTVSCRCGGTPLNPIYRSGPGVMHCGHCSSDRSCHAICND